MGEMGPTQSPTIPIHTILDLYVGTVDHPLFAQPYTCQRPLLLIDPYKKKTSPKIKKEGSPVQNQAVTYHSQIRYRPFKLSVIEEQ